MPDQAIRGDTKKWSIAFEDAQGNPLDLSGCTVWFTAKQMISNDLSDADAIIQHMISVDETGGAVTADGFEIGGVHPVTQAVATTAAEGVLTQVLSPADSTLIAAGTYVYDVQIETASGEVYTPILGQSITFVEDVTRSMV